MKRLLGGTAALLALFVASTTFAEDLPFDPDKPFADAKAVAAAAGKPILVDFYATW